MSPVKLSCAACATLAFSRHGNRAVVVIRQDSMPGAEVLTSWKQCNTGGYTRSPGLSARLSPPGCCHSYHTQRCWQGKAVTITLAWLPLPFCSPSTHKQTPLLSFGGSPSSASFASAAKEMLLLLWSSNKDLLWHMHHILTLMHCVQIWWVNHVKAWHFLGGERGKRIACLKFCFWQRNDVAPLHGWMVHWNIAVQARGGWRFDFSVFPYLSPHSFLT